MLNEMSKDDQFYRKYLDQKTFIPFHGKAVIIAQVIPLVEPINDTPNTCAIIDVV